MQDTIQNRADARKKLQELRAEIGLLAADMDHVDHDAGRFLLAAREQLHNAWLILREAPIAD